MACHNGVLVQGSPLSPVISNIVANVLDSRMLVLCKKHRCKYSRYADDITISTRSVTFPKELAFEANSIWLVGDELNSLIERFGFELNTKKTRMHYWQSRQSVTNLTVNQIVNIRRTKFKRIRAQINQFTRDGVFLDDKKMVGDRKKLRGLLDYCFWVKKNNGYFNSENCNLFVSEGEKEKVKFPRTSFEWLFYKFLFASFFIHNTRPSIIFEGETDYVYFRNARKSATTKSTIKTRLHFLTYSRTVREILRLRGGTSNFPPFISSYSKTKNGYSKVTPANIVVFVLDNDDGLNPIVDQLKKLAKLEKKEAKKREFIHLVDNLYIVLTPIGGNFPKDKSCIENLFLKEVFEKKNNGKSFNPELKKNEDTKTFGKGVFAQKIIAPNAKSIDFANFDIIFDRITKAMEHYQKTIISSP